MKKLLLLIALITVHSTLVAQKARVFEHFTPAFAFGDGVLAPSLAYTQTLALGKKFGFRVNTGLRYTQYIVKSPAELENTVASKSRTLTLQKNTSTTALNVPIGVELGNRTVAIGINADLIGITIAKSRDKSTFNINNATAPDGLALLPQGFNFLITQSGTFNSQGYVAVTPNQNLTIKLGMAYTQNQFNTQYPDSDAPDVSLSWDSFTEQAFRPFVGLQFNFEK